MIFREKLCILESPTTYSDRQLCGGNVFIKWKKRIILVILLLILCTSLGYIVHKEANNAKDNVFVKTKKASSDCVLEQYADGCNLNCRNKLINATIDEINSITLNECLTIKELTLEAVIFDDNGVIGQNWLSRLRPLYFATLKLIRTNLRELGPRSFAGRPFANLIYLSIQQSKIAALKRTTFLDAPPIQTLELSFSTFTRITVEAHTLDPVQGSLTALQLVRCIGDETALHNITGANGSALTQLQQLDLRFNSLAALPQDVFRNAKRVQQVFLGHNGLEAVADGAFAANVALRYLDLSHNSLKTLPKGAFGFIDAAAFTLQITNNFWNCNCHLSWLRRLYERVRNKDTFECLQDGERVDYKEVVFCENATGTTTPAPTAKTALTNSSVAGSTTPALPPRRVTVSCAEGGPAGGDGGRRRVAELSVRNRTLAFAVETGEDGEFYVRLNGTRPDDYLLWFDNRNLSARYCQKVADYCYPLAGLQRRRTYTFCVVQRDADSVSPFDCAGVALRGVGELWLSPEGRLRVFGGAAAALLLACALTGVAVFLCIRQHPSLIRGNKRVIIVESKAADAIVMPSPYHGSGGGGGVQNYMPPSLLSYSDGYLTPKTYDHVLQPLATIAEYGAYPPPVRRRQSYLKRRKQAHLILDENFYEPPPLPPNHPCEGKGLAVPY